MRITSNHSYGIYTISRCFEQSGNVCAVRQYWNYYCYKGLCILYYCTSLLEFERRNIIRT